MGEITLVGYGNQGRAWAANLRDSGWKVTVTGRSSRSGGKGIAAANQDGFATCEPEAAAKRGGIFALLLPDERIPAFHSQYLSDSGPARSLLFAHGFSVIYGGILPRAQDDLILVAPKGIGVKLRENYQKGGGVMGVVGVEKDASGKSRAVAQSVAEGLGLTRVGLIESSFAEETVTDLLSEQAILCGAVPRLVEETIRFLTDKGVNPRLATYECLHELKLIVDMMVARGVAGMLSDVSNTAKFGGLEAADSVLPRDQLRASLEGLWAEIRSGRFAGRLKAEDESNFRGTRQRIASMAWVDKNL